MDFDDEPPPMSSPKLTRCDETSPTSAAPARALSASTSTGEIGLGMEPALPTLDLKPRDFRRKDPALHFLAGIRGDTEELEMWLLAGGDPNARDGEGWALLHHASVSSLRLIDYWRNVGFLGFSYVHGRASFFVFGELVRWYLVARGCSVARGGLAMRTGHRPLHSGMVVVRAWRPVRRHDGGLVE